ncbi:MAG: tetratricopeptide repeat protein [Fimbriimonadales bacterium]|nr:tetratricopeptide repeat protein [Fimbriimonadales bacterium]
MKPTRLTIQTSERIWTPLERRLAARLRHAPLGLCLTFEQFTDLAQHGRRCPNYHAHMLHLVSCPACRRAYLELRALLRLQRPSLSCWLRRIALPQFPQWALASGAAFSVFALALWTFYPRTPNPQLVATEPRGPSYMGIAQKPPEDPNRPGTSELQQIQNQKPSEDDQTALTNSSTKRGDHRSEQQRGKPVENKSGADRADTSTDTRTREDGNELPHDQQGTGERTIAQKRSNPTDGPSRTDETPRDTRSPLEQGLAALGATLRLPASEINRAFASLSAGSVRRSGASQASFGRISLKKPDLSNADLTVNKEPFVLVESPVFEWQPVDGALKYLITLRNSNGELVLEDELDSQQVEYRVSRSLDPEQTYEFTLRAIRGQLRTLEGKLRFQVMSGDQLHALQVARENVQHYPELSGTVFYLLKRYKEALDAFEEAQRRDPENEKLRSIVNSLRARVGQ